MTEYGNAIAVACDADAVPLVDMHSVGGMLTFDFARAAREHNIPDDVEPEMVYSTLAVKSEWIRPTAGGPEWDTDEFWAAHPGWEYGSPAPEGYEYWWDGTTYYTIIGWRCEA